ncbi:MAG: SGNH/GDSL hydrolase family protein [Candidatus Eremiobacteraeota bacterium]|nr:SGNH/GDSL hydrolase family protein [Candidatus Eremiobacteraeota bacterium]MBV8497720.1 SGNH/GDSL hydrolase family protein [Candidatus Eremiobacteraeota bacterium]
MALATTFAVLTGCGGGNLTGAQSVVPSAAGGRARDAVTQKIVGVGDSLTAGYQSDGILGQTGVRNPIFPGSSIPPTQENGWWALLAEQASSLPLQAAIAQMYDPSTSPLPLIKGPGLDNQIVPAGPSNFAPFGQFKGTDSCTYDHGFNQAGFGLRSSARVRMDPNSTSVHDVGVPGLTLHEAITIHQPETDTCSPLPGIPGLLSDVVNEESGTFWPVLRNFTNLGPHLTEVNAAASRHPSLATVWLGANDVLKYMGSGGRFVGGDRNAGQAEGDIRATISTLQHSGARVVLANLPNILETGYFQRVGPLRGANACRIASYARCLMAISPGVASFLPSIAKEYHLNAPGCVPASVTKPCGYLTLAATVLIINYIGANGNAPNLDCAVPAPHCKAVKGSGLGGNYITPEFAAKVQALNDAINQGIDNAATAARVPLVDVNAIFHGLASGDPSNPYFAAAASIAPGVCCTLGFIHFIGSTAAPGGILSFDGIHPSDTGYALIAYDFIKVINKAYGAHIPEVDVKGVYDGSRCSKLCYPDPYAPHT